MIFIGTIYAYNKGTKIEKNRYPSKWYKLLLLSIISSIVMVVLYQNQSLRVTIIATFPYFAGYFFFWILLRLDIESKHIKLCIKYLLAVSILIYFINLITFPNTVFSSRAEIDESRGMIRIYVPFIELHVLGFFYSINKWLIDKKNKKWMFYTVIETIMIVLSVTRQYIAFAALLGMLLILQNTSIYKKVFALIIASVLLFVVIPHIPIFSKMIELTVTQSEQNKYEEEDIRIKAWRYYTYENQTNEITPFCGNGVPSFGNSQWGIKFEKETDYNRCFAVDVGWAGFIYYFGYIGAFSLFMLLLAAMRKKKSINDAYLTYWIVFIILTSVMSGSILYNFQIISISTVLYLVYAKKTEENSIAHTQLQ